MHGLLHALRFSKCIRAARGDLRRSFYEAMMEVTQEEMSRMMNRGVGTVLNARP